MPVMTRRELLGAGAAGAVLAVLPWPKGKETFTPLCYAEHSNRQSNKLLTGKDLDQQALEDAVRLVMELPREPLGHLTLIRRPS